MTRRLRPLLLLLGLVVLSACESGQLVDAGAGAETGEGGLAFVLLATMVFVFAGFLVVIDRARRKRGGDGEE
ncbi:MAG: hypothetical protein M5U14_15410 [Acidimicrobiia bacterium]|nr:hypothetical protein [Acidimicrobiia bacterium]